MIELEKLKRDLNNKNNDIVNQIELVTKKYKEGDEFLQKQINDCRTIFNNISKDINSELEKRNENINDKLNKFENKIDEIMKNFEKLEKEKPKIINNEGVLRGGNNEGRIYGGGGGGGDRIYKGGDRIYGGGDRIYTGENRYYGGGIYGDGVMIVNKKNYNNKALLLLIIILICILYILVGVIFWMINKNDYEKRIDNIEIYIIQNISEIEEKIYKKCSCTNNL
jgi:hypothetical protein